MSTGAGHSLALIADGSLSSWGGGDRGILGHGDGQNQLLPKKIEALAGRGASSPCRLARLPQPRQHRADGAVLTWGKGESGCLGHGEDLSDQLLPKKIEAWAPGQ